MIENTNANKLSDIYFELSDGRFYDGGKHDFRMFIDYVKSRISSLEATIEDLKEEISDLKEDHKEDIKYIKEDQREKIDNYSRIVDFLNYYEPDLFSKTINKHSHEISDADKEAFRYYFELDNNQNAMNKLDKIK